ncbi:hypothetical protein, partial [Paraburkholderia sp. SIMBA_053]|uniref:hypothetical protein n=1 Tax=Paraburkholderia sp. SIMBA_053 TaxID=3085794 RepID=UPI00397C6305
VPVSPAILTFKDSQTNTALSNNISGLTVSRIVFDTDASDYSIAGNSITLKSDLINNSSEPQKLSLPISVNGQLNVNAKTN